MKGIDALIASVLIIAITIAAIAIALQLSNSSTDKMKEIMLMQEGKDNLVTIDNSVKDVLTEGEGSTRALRLTVSGGSYVIDDDSVSFVMETMSQIVGVGVSKVESGVNITGSEGVISLMISYDDLVIAGGGDFGRGQRTVTVRNDGFNATSGKQIVHVSAA